MELDTKRLYAWLLVMTSLPFVRGDVESTLARCCVLGANWAREEEACALFPTPVQGEPSEHQSICLTSAAICCLRFYREQQCEAGKAAAQRGQDCRLPAAEGGEYYKDCCEGCKLGLVSGSMALSCSFRSLQFGFPWDSAYSHCCSQLHPELPVLPRPGVEDDTRDNSVLYPGSQTIADAENLCLLFPGQLCAHVCVPVPGSYSCQCRAGFTLSLDKKTCLQDKQGDRCSENDACEHICRDTGVAIECACDPGYRLASDQRTCLDIDECTAGLHSCMPGEQVCYNQDGTYACVNPDGSLTSPWVAPLNTPAPRGPASRGSIAAGLGPGGSEVAFGGAPTTDRTEYFGGSPGRCPTGYRYNTRSRVCDDIDECLTVQNLCGRGGLCTNTIGSYTCTPMPRDTCPPGYLFDLPLQSCLDIDECAAEQDNCDHAEQFCINTQGGFMCQPRQDTPGACPAGYKYNEDNSACEDVDECAEGLSVCREDEVCRNSVGAYDCNIDCDLGFQFSLGLQTCVDIDECREGLHNCGDQECVNMPGSHRCEDKGFTRLDGVAAQGAAGYSYEVPLEGLPLTNSIHTVTAEVKECPPGFGFDFSSRQCLDIDECQGGVHNCTVGQERCINTLGSFRCRRRRRCPPGYTRGAGGDCVDVDECDSGGRAICMPGQICVNGLGTFECQVECRDGFKYDPSHPMTCADIDECLDSPCGASQTCTNTEGSYICRRLGDSQRPEVEANDRQDYGSQTPHSEAARPLRPPWRGSQHQPGVPPTEAPEPEVSVTPSVEQIKVTQSCPPGYARATASSECEDVDECSTGRARCRPGEVCLNHPGGYRCRLAPTQPSRQCPQGHRFSSDTNDCIDVNECEERRDSCSSSQTCINSVGSYRCIDRSPTCPFGYRHDPATRECLDVNECTESKQACSALEICINQRGGYLCRTRAGQGSDDEENLGSNPVLAGEGATSISRSNSQRSKEIVDPRTSWYVGGNNLGNASTLNTESDRTLSNYSTRKNEVYRNRTRLNLGSRRSNIVLDYPMRRGNEVTNFIETSTERPRPVSRRRPGGFNRSDTQRTNNPVQQIGLEDRKQNRAEIRRNLINFTSIDAGSGNNSSIGNDLGVNLDVKVTISAEAARIKLLQDRTRYTLNLANSFIDTSRAFHENATRKQTGREQQPAEDTRGQEVRGHNADREPNLKDIQRHGRRGQELKEQSTGWGQNEKDTRGQKINERRTDLVYHQNDSEDKTHEDNTRDRPGRTEHLLAGSYYQYRLGGADKVKDLDEQILTNADHREKTVLTSQAPEAVIRALPRESSKGRMTSVARAREIIPSTEGHRTDVGRSKVACAPGFTKNEQKDACVDINECREGRDFCDALTERCTNLPGGYRCKPLTVPIRGPPSTATLPNNASKTPSHLVPPSPPPLPPRPDLVEESSSSTADTNPTTSLVSETQMEESEALSSKTPGNAAAQTHTSSVAASLQPTIALLLKTTSTLPSLPPPTTSPTFTRCPPGFKYDQLIRTCKDEDECQASPCATEERCRNTLGSFECHCREGYREDSNTGRCKDINECQLGNYDCDTSQRCDNTIGSYTCVRISGCGTGYTLNHNNGLCEDDDECDSGKHDCDQLGPQWVCVNNKGSFRCEKKTCPDLQYLGPLGDCVNVTCPQGYTPFKKTCVDIDECSVAGPSPCRPNENCVNQQGSHSCQPKILCSRGFRMNDAGDSCVDIDECATGAHECSGGQECNNRQGTYTCQCPPGYRLDHARQCQDIDECTSFYGAACSSNAACQNTPGSFFCNCHDGFTKTEEGGRNCIDVDECSVDPNVCHHRCINIRGGYQCICNAGYNLSPDNRTCVDVDECEETRGRRGGRLCIGVCENTPGSFQCSCPSGYSLSPDQRTCKDSNECDRPGVCRNANEQCINTRGGHRCMEIMCPQDYDRDTSHKSRCKKKSLFCRKGDLECAQQPLSYSYNFLPLVSNMSLPSTGQVDLFTMRGPLWSTATVHFALDMETTRAPSGIAPATRDFFRLRRTSVNQAVISLVTRLEGPQEVQLALSMKLYHENVYSGSAVAKLLILVSEYDF